MATELTTDSGADVRIYRFRDFLGAGAAALIVTEYSHLLSEGEREYPPAAMSDEAHFDHRGNPA